MLTMNKKPFEKSVVFRPGFTLLEMAIGIIAAAILTMSVGILLADGQKYYNRLYTRVNGTGATDTYVVRQAFDAICRKSSWRKCIISPDGSELTLYYYRTGSTSIIPDQYAWFYISDGQLFVEHGDLKSGTWIPDTSIAATQVFLASRVNKVKFSMQGTAVSVLLFFEQQTEALPVGCTAVRHNE